MFIIQIELLIKIDLLKNLLYYNLLRKILSFIIYYLYIEVINHWVKLNTILIRMLVIRFSYTIISKYT